MAKGLSVNVADPRFDNWIERDQKPCFLLKDGTPVFEVWFWHVLLQQWFCMAWELDSELVKAGVVWFTPTDVPKGLRERMLALETSVGIKRS